MEENLKQLKRATKISKVAFYLVQGTGKTTLARQLAAYYKTEWCLNLLSDYLAAKMG
jgi:replication-associated recombination protein RarA